MAKKSKDDWKKEGEAVKATFASAKKKQQNFGLVYAKEGMVLAAHPTHSSDKLFKDAKSAPDGSTKGTQGVLNVTGTVIEFKYEGTEKDLPGGIETRFKQYLSLLGIKGFKVEFVPDAGDGAAPAKKAEEAKGGDEAAKPAPKPGGAEAAKPGAEKPGAADEKKGGDDKEPSKEELTKNFRHITDIFKLSFPGMDENQTKELQGALKAIGGAISGGDLVGAMNMMNKLGLLTGVTKDSPMQAIVLAQPKKKKGEKLSPEEAKKKKKELTKSLADIKPDLQKTLVDADKKEQSELQKLIKDFGKQMKSDEMEDAEESFDQIKEKVEVFLKKQANAGDGEEVEEAPTLSPEREAERAGHLDEMQKKLDALLASF